MHPFGISGYMTLLQAFLKTDFTERSFLAKARLIHCINKIKKVQGKLSNNKMHEQPAHQGFAAQEIVKKNSVSYKHINGN